MKNLIKCSILTLFAISLIVLKTYSQYNDIVPTEDTMLPGIEHYENLNLNLVL